MEQSKFSLADLLTIVGAMAFGFICFLGLNFIQMGDDLKSIGFASAFTIVLFLCAFGAKLLKRSDHNFRTSVIFEFILVALFILIFVTLSYSPFPHFFNVTSQRSEVQKNLKASINQAENMFEEYEDYASRRENLYRNNLRSVVAAKNTMPSDYARYGFSSSEVSDEKQIENKMFTIHADLFPTNYCDTITHNGIKDIAQDWLDDADKTVDLWKPIGIPRIAKEVKTESEGWLNTLVDYSRVREKGEVAKDFEYDLSFSEVKDILTQEKAPGAFSIILSIILWGMMMFSWMITKRHPRFPGWKMIFSNHKKAIDEL